jgi:NAD(P)-dependent dehydrogenase (short-subunit alcohol dehydrogenase family)
VHARSAGNDIGQQLTEECLEMKFEGVARLDGKVALITGAAGGMGLVAAHLFAQQGAKVMIADFNAESAAAAAADIVANGATAASVHGDVARSADVQAMVEATVAKFGGLHVLYNNAGIMMGDDDNPVTTSEDVWDRTFDVNAKGVFLCLKHAVPAMLASGGGSIINVASFVAHMGAATPQIAYTATKGAVLSMTREVAAIYARQGIRCNALCPGPVGTPLLAELWSDPARKARRIVHIPMGRWAEAEELARAALFLASDDSSFMTGQSLIVDGGIVSTYTTPE